MTKGDYPQIIKDLVKERLPKFSEDEKQLLKDSFDFIGISYYSSHYMKNAKIDDPDFSNDY